METDTSREKLTYKVTLEVTRTLCIVVLVTIIAGYIPARMIVKKNTLDSILGRN